MQTPRAPEIGIARGSTGSLGGEDVRSVAETGFSCNQYRARDAATLDRLADVELSHGHHAAAERLAWKAEDLRAGGAG